jgi:hypothetical protein
MKMLNVALIAGVLATGAVAPALADDTTSSSPTYRDQLEMLWISTGDPTYARLMRQYDAQAAGIRPGEDYQPGY